MSETIGVSSGTLHVLGLSKATVMVEPTCAHLMVGRGCVNACSFCAQAASSRAPQHHLSRVTWPEFSWEEIEAPLVRAAVSGRIRRICIQVVESAVSPKASLDALRRLKTKLPWMPISVCAAPYSLARVSRYLEAGASVVGLPIDAASRGVYHKVKGRDFDKTWELVKKASATFPGRVTTHFIVGLGETEREMVEALERARQAGVRVGLFAFTPVRGTEMEQVSPPPVDYYRRVQIVNYLMKRGGTIEDIEFCGDRVTDVRVADRQVLEDIWRGVPFMTSGCPGCNRPYYNERPGQEFMNFPRPLLPEEAQNCLAEADINLEYIGGENRQCNRCV